MTKEIQDYRNLARELALSIDNLMRVLSTHSLTSNEVWSYFYPILLRDDVSDLLYKEADERKISHERD